MKKKTIKKPRLWKYLIPAAIPALIVAVFLNMLGYYFADTYVRNMLDGSNEGYYSDLEEVVDLYYENPENGGKSNEEYIAKLSRLCGRISVSGDEFQELSIGSEKLFSSQIPGMLAYDKKIYRMADDQELHNKIIEATGPDMQMGRMELWRFNAASATIIQFGDNETISGKLWNFGTRFLKVSVNKDSKCPGSIMDAYIDEENLIFYPGHVLFYDIDYNEYQVDLTPADTTGLKHIYKNEVQDAGGQFFGLVLNPYDPDSATDDATYEETTEDPEHTYTWRVATYLVPPLIEIFPVQCVIVWLIVVLIFLAVAFLIGRARYMSAKAMYDVIEYRMKTTDAMAHDLKTPLAVLSAYADNMKDDSDPEKLRGYAAKMQSNVINANHMLEDILNFSKSESDTLKVEPKQVSVMSVVNEVVDEFKDVFEKENMKVKTSGEDITLTTDPKQLSQAIGNLVSNGVKHGKRGGEVQVDLQGDKLTISNQTDLKTEDVNELRKPFVKGSSSRGSGGTGLGLSVADNDLTLLGYKLDLQLQDGIFKAIISFK